MNEFELADKINGKIEAARTLLEVSSVGNDHNRGRITAFREVLAMVFPPPPVVEKPTDHTEPLTIDRSGI